MSEIHGGKRWSEGPRIRVRNRVIHRGETGSPDDRMQVTTDPLRGDLRAAERRFLLLQSSSAEGRWSEILAGYLDLMAELRVIGTRLQELADRRDLSFLADRRLNVLQDHCLWLARRAISAFLLMLQLRLEQELRRVLGPRGYQMFLRLEDIADVAHEVEALSERDLMTRLRDGTLMREILDQGFLQDDTGLPLVESTPQGNVRGRLPD